jgi:hypothetical protein
VQYPSTTTHGEVSQVRVRAVRLGSTREAARRLSCCSACSVQQPMHVSTREGISKVFRSSNLRPRGGRNTLVLQVSVSVSVSQVLQVSVSVSVSRGGRNTEPTPQA